MGNCVVNLSTIDPSCAAFKSVAGVRSFGWFCRVADFISVTRDDDGTVTAFTVPTGKLKRFTTGKFQNSGATALAASDIGKTRFTQTYLNRVYYRDQADRNAMTALIQAEDVVYFSPNNDNQIEVYGLELGLKVTALAAGTGTKLDDDNTALLTFTGTESSFPPLFNTAGPITAISSSTATTDSTSLSVVSATGIVAGQAIIGSGIADGTTVVSVSGTTLTLSAEATVPASTTLTLAGDEATNFLVNKAYLDAKVGA